MAEKIHIDLSKEAINFLGTLRFTENLSNSTICAYASDVQQIFWGRKKVLRFDGSNILLLKGTVHCIFEGTESEFLSLIRIGILGWEGLEASSVSRKVGALRKFLKFLFFTQQIRSDLSVLFSGPYIPQKIPNFLSFDEVLAVWKSIFMKNQICSHTLLLFIFLYVGGLRIGEAGHIQWENFSDDFKTLLVNGKGRIQRIVTFPDWIGRIFKHFAFCSKGSFVFGDQGLHPRTGFRIVRTMGINAQLDKPLNPHSLRHSFATHILSNGADIRILQSLLGHQSLVATSRYLHLDIDHLATVVENLHPLSSKPSALCK